MYYGRCSKLPVTVVQSLQVPFITCLVNHVNPGVAAGGTGFGLFLLLLSFLLAVFLLLVPLIYDRYDFFDILAI